MKEETKKLLKDYETDKNGIITSPGKFESEMRYVPYFWNMTMEGWTDDFFDEGTWISHLKITKEDAQEFEELKHDVGSHCYMEETETGFIYCTIRKESPEELNLI